MIRKLERFSELCDYLREKYWNSTSHGQQYFHYVGHCYSTNDVRLFESLRLLVPMAELRIYVDFMVLGVSTITVVQEVERLHMDFVDDNNAKCIIKRSLQGCGCGFPFPDEDLYILGKAYRSWLEKKRQ